MLPSSVDLQLLLPCLEPRGLNQLNQVPDWSEDDPFVSSVVCAHASLVGSSVCRLVYRLSAAIAANDTTAQVHDKPGANQRREYAYPIVVLLTFVDMAPHTC
ncbi:unnamed protein product [Protopolystoma xenopodis]|uniref:Uncharacterized protein n=1 Tax=Protopolystoma xenopodis TaxID=117903 RepID=A0A3S4ZDG6_9PLAT|nr:unnamed protein product [Protopolystoma xenopodis]